MDSWQNTFPFMHPFACLYHCAAVVFRSNWQTVRYVIYLLQANFVEIVRDRILWVLRKDTGLAEESISLCDLLI